MRRIEWVDTRLRQWAQWRLSGSTGYRSPSFEYEEPTTQGISPMEFDAESERDALEMDQAIASLPQELADVVVAYYTWQGGMAVIEQKIRVTRATVHRRLCHADLRIVDWLDAQAAARRRVA